MTIFDFPALCAYHLADLLSTENTLKQVLSCSVFEGCFKSIEEQIEELLGVFLFDSVGRLPIKLFKGKAESEGIVVHAV